MHHLASSCWSATTPLVGSLPNASVDQLKSRLQIFSSGAAGFKLQKMRCWVPLAWVSRWLNFLQGCNNTHFMFSPNMFFALDGFLVVSKSNLKIQNDLDSQIMFNGF